MSEKSIYQSPQSSRGDRPVFVVGYQRSGTTLLREEISALPNFCIPPESSFLTWLWPEFSNWRQEDCHTARVGVFAEALSKARKFWLWELNTHLVQGQISLEQPANYAELVSAVYRAYATKVGKPLAQWGDKNNVHGLHLSTITELYPHSRIIWVVRNPRDVWSSLKNLRRSDPGEPASDIAPKLPPRVEDFCREWNAYQSVIEDFLASRPVNCRLLLVSYEDLVSNTNNVLAKVYQFLGEISGTSDRRKRTLAELGPESSLSWKNGITEPAHSKSVGRFHSNLTVTESSLIESCTQAPDVRFFEDRISSKTVGREATTAVKRGVSGIG